jgi:CRP-like cAMP-binding protein
MGLVALGERWHNGTPHCMSDVRFGLFSPLGGSGDLQLAPSDARAGTAPVDAESPRLALQAAGTTADSGSSGADERDAIERFMAAQELARGMTPGELRALSGLMRARIYPPGAVIIEEGALHDKIFFVRSGAARVLKQSPSRQTAFTVSHVDAGSGFGEMSFLDHQPASATVQATTECSVVYVTRGDLDRLDEREARGVREKLTNGVALTMVKRMRFSSDAHVRALQSELAESQLRNEFARFFIITMILFGLASLVQKVIRTGVSPSVHMVYSWGILLLTLAPIAWFARRQSHPTSSFGLTLCGWRRSLGEAAACSAVLCVAAVTYRLAFRGPGEPLVTWGSLAGYSPAEFAFFFIAYGPHSFLQEFIGRGVIQGSLARFIPDAGSAAPILLTSALFGIFHTYVSVSFALITFVVSVFFGKLYQRHGTLLGVTVLHCTLGTASVALGFN